MDPAVLRDLDEARGYLRQGLWWQRVVPPEPGTVRDVLEWAKEVAASGQPLPPPGFVADLGHAAFRLDAGVSGRDAPALPGVPVNLLRAYEDQVLGKLYADWTFARAAESLRRLHGRDRARGLAFLLNQFRERAALPGVLLSPGVITAALEAPAEEVLNQGWAELERGGLQPLLIDLYESLVAAARRTAEVLGPEDLPELENGTALEDEGPRLARRQVRRAAALLAGLLPRRRVRPRSRRDDVPTHLLDEDTYPVGGFHSLSTRGSVESLLYSQLAYMEDDGQRPDLFDVKFLRDELLYYSRDENQFRRRRRTFVLALHPDLVASRYKDRELPYQRGVLLLALVVLAVRKLTEWLAADALTFRVVFLHAGPAPGPLAAERSLLRALLPDLLAAGTLHIGEATPERLAADCELWARRSLCSCLVAAVAPPVLRPERTRVCRLQVSGPRPALADADEEPAPVEGDDAVEAWGKALEELLRRWV